MTPATSGPQDLVSMGAFADDTVVRPAGDSRYGAELDDAWNLAQLPQGGLVASLALRAAAMELGEPSQELRSCTTVFAGQVAPGELEVEVKVLRRGRSASQVTATVRNVGKPSGATSLAVFGSRRRGPSFVDVATWLRFDDPPRLQDGTLDPLGIVTLADRMPGCIAERIGSGSEPWFAPSADLTVHLFGGGRDGRRLQ